MDFPRHKKINDFFVADLTGKIAAELDGHYSFSTSSFSEIAIFFEVDDGYGLGHDNHKLYSALFRALKKMLEEGSGAERWMLHKNAVEYFFSLPFSYSCDRDGIEKGKYPSEGAAFFFIYDHLRTHYGIHAGFFPVKGGYQFTGYHLPEEENQMPTPVLTAEGETRFAGIVRLLQKCIERN